MNLYKVLKEKQKKEIDDFPFIFAFTNEQLEEGLKKYGLTMNDRDKICNLGSGIFMQKKDIELYKDMSNRHNQEIQNEIANDKTGENFVKDMFKYELQNHEYGYTLEIEDTLEALNLTIDDINNNPNLLNGLELAKQDILKDENEETEEMGEQE